MKDDYYRKKREVRAKRDDDYEQRKARALSEGSKTLFVTCPLCGVNRPIKRWGKTLEFVIKPDYFLIQARYSFGRGSGFFLNKEDSLLIEQVKEQYPEIYDNLKKSIKELSKIFI